ncbi:MAG: formimidoylglutamate deiminase [Actinomycetales bacterium]
MSTGNPDLQRDEVQRDSVEPAGPTAASPDGSGYWLEHAWLPSGPARSVRVRVRDGRFASVEVGVDPEPQDEQIAGLVLPGLANAHSHAFHRALRGRTHTGDGAGTFWLWRQKMYDLAGRLEPDSYTRLATAVFAEMAAAGITCVGEFHYLHHRPDGTPYPDPNAFGLGLIDASRAAGIRITLLDTCYLAGGLSADGHSPLAGPQVRFGDGDVAGWRARVTPPATGPLGAHARWGAAIHSVRGVPAHALAEVAAVAAEFDLPLHVHLSEQPAENAAALAYYGRTPTQLLDEAGALGPRVTAVHATHLSELDIARLGATGTRICACPTTEADLADGIGPFPALAEAGCGLCLGSDQHAHTDLLAEARRMEEHQRLVSGTRGTFSPAALLQAATVGGHESLGWGDAGRIAVGARADLVGVDLRSVRTAGSEPAQAIMCATAADVTDVVVDGQRVVTAGRHRAAPGGDVGRLLAEAIEQTTQDLETVETAR